MFLLCFDFFILDGGGFFTGAANMAAPGADRPFELDFSFFFSLLVVIVARSGFKSPLGFAAAKSGRGMSYYSTYVDA